MAAFFDKAYIPEPARRTDPLVSPAWKGNSDDLTGIAPALVITAEHDRLRAEAVDYAAKLKEAGALVAHHDVPGVDHGYDLLGDDPEPARKMYGIIAEHVRNATT
ncbi:alpha/beta hydrolase fold domain-containing protein [Streptomyces rochei]|uniref:alpha/beta hydrolase fold domain-containing protein n=1 Tax=Streptomyces rochei TaxID=1928 RepID=UPI003D8ED416